MGNVAASSWRALSIALPAAMGVWPVVVSPAEPVEVELCKRALLSAHIEHVEGAPATLTIGDATVVTGNAANAGFLCVLGAGKPKVAVSDVVTGLDTVGTIRDPKRIDVAGRPFLATLQTFRGGSNARREAYVWYELHAGKARKALEIPSRKELAIADYRLSEHNTLTTRQSDVQVSQELSVRKAARGKGDVLYRASRRFALTYAPEFSSFVEGVGICVQDLPLQDGKIWLKKGRRFGYVFEPGIAEAGGLTLRLVREDGETTIIKDLMDFVFLGLGTSATGGK